MEECKTHKPVIHECIEMIVYGHKHNCRPTHKGNVRLDCETVDQIISKLSNCDCSKRHKSPEPSRPILEPDWGLMGEAGIECRCCFKFYNHEVRNIVDEGIKIVEIEQKTEKLPQTKEEADKFLASVEWDEGKNFFSEMKKLAERGKPTSFLIGGVYPKTENEILSKMGTHISSFKLFSHLVLAWSGGKLGISTTTSMSPLTLHLTDRLEKTFN